MDFEQLWLGLIALAGLAAAAWVHLGLKTSPCLFHSLTGLPCPTCGGTRCVINLLNGHFAAAFAWNPMVFLGAAAAAAYALYALAAIMFRLPRVRLSMLTSTEAHVTRIVVAAVLAANWIYLIVSFSHAA